MNKILIIDDDSGLCELLAEYLGAEGFQTEIAGDGASGAKMAISQNYDLIILDVMLPEISGFETLRNIRDEKATPIIMLTARGEEIDRIVGLEMGADDYLAKPFNPRELIARIKAVLRRAQNGNSEANAFKNNKTIIAGDVEMEISSRKVTCLNKNIELTSVEFTILKVLIQNAGNMVSRETLFKVALGRDSSVYDRSIDVHVSKLRKKLDCDSTGIERIKTVRSAGYLYIAGSQAASCCT